MGSISVSDSAAKRIGKIIEKEAGMAALRISVEGGGCSGFSYKFDLVPEVAADDLVFEKNGAKVIVDPVSIDYMDGSELDFIDNLMGQSFQVKNPLRRPHAAAEPVSHSEYFVVSI